MASYFLFNAFIRTSEQLLGVAAFSKQIWPWEGIFHSNNFLHNKEIFFPNIAGVLFRNHKILVPAKMKTIHQPFGNGFAHFQNLQPKLKRPFIKVCDIWSNYFYRRCKHCIILKHAGKGLWLALAFVMHNHYTENAIVRCLPLTFLAL